MYKLSHFIAELDYRAFYCKFEDFWRFLKDFLPLSIHNINYATTCIYVVYQKFAILRVCAPSLNLVIFRGLVCKYNILNIYMKLVFFYLITMRFDLIRCVVVILLTFKICMCIRRLLVVPATDLSVEIPLASFFILDLIVLV